MAIEHILIPVDFSQDSNLAARVGVAIAAHHGASVRLVHALDLRPRIEIEPEVQDRFTESVTRRTREAMERLVLEVRGADDIGSAILHGEIGPALLAAASDPPASLIVIGSSGERGDDRLGSVAARLIRSVDCPVLVLRARHGDRISSDGMFHRPLVAVDYSRFTAPAIRSAAALTAPGETIELFHALFVPDLELVSDDEVGAIYARAFSTAAGDQQRRLEREAQGAGIEHPITCTVQMGRPGALISAHLDAHPHDLVIAGAHGRPEAAEQLVGSVADNLLRSSPAPVLYIPDAVHDGLRSP